MLLQSKRLMFINNSNSTAFFKNIINIFDIFTISQRMGKKLLSREKQQTSNISNNEWLVKFLYYNFRQDRFHQESDKTMRLNFLSSHKFCENIFTLSKQV